MNTVNEITQHVGQATSVAISFDVTGSMSAAISSVKNTLREFTAKIFNEIPGLRISIIAHGDYCDGPNYIQMLDFSEDKEKIINFISNVRNMGGGDAPECYEMVLERASLLKWGPEGGSLMMIGDTYPHGVRENPDRLDWKVCLEKLKKKNIKVFGLQCLRNRADVTSSFFWEEFADLAETPLLLLEDFNESIQNMEAITYATFGSEGFARYSSSVKTKSASFMGNIEKLTSYSGIKK